MGFFSKKEKTPAVEKKTEKKSVVKPVKVDAEKKEKKDKKISKTATVKKHVAKPILIRPLITEKVTDLAKKNQYVFAVHKNVNKIEVKDEIKNTYNVEPVKVNMISIKGKHVRFGRTAGKQKDWKKAIVILKDGDKIIIGKEK